MNYRVKFFLSVKLACLIAGLTALAASAQTTSTLGNLPLYFEANQGQANVAAQFIARGRDSQFLISSGGAQMVLCKSAAETTALRMQFIGANPLAQIRGDAGLSGKINYLVGNDPAQWRLGIPTFAKVSVAEIYPGIGLVYYGNQQQLEYDFTIASGANPDVIAIRFDGAHKISVNAQGELVLTLTGGEIRQPKPVIYQTVGGTRKVINGGYRMVDACTVAFSIGEYDRALPLVIDPTLSFSTYFGGNRSATAWAVAVNTNDGSIYIAGQTLSKQFYPTPGAFQTNFAGGTKTGDAFVAKFDNTGQNLLYFTYLGGSGDDAAYGLAVDSAGDAYIAGFTDSTNFPTTNAIYPRISGTFNKDFRTYLADAFVAELNPGGSNLVYSTYLGGEAPDAAYGIAVDSSGDAYVTGFTYSTNFPTTNAIQNHLACTYSEFFNANAFVTEIAAGGSNLVFSTYLGGTNFDQGQGIAVDGAGNIYVTGYTASTNFPTYNPLYPQLNGSTNRNNSRFDAFVAKFPPFSTNWIYSASNQVYSISNLVYSTYLGGTNNDFGRAIACDAVGDAFVTGSTASTNFPDTATNIPGLYSFIATNRTATLATNAFLTEISSNGSNLVFSALFGGKGNDVGNGVAVDPLGEVFVTGSASSTNFPVFNVPGFMRSTNSGKSDAFVIGFNTNATALLYSAYLGGKSYDFGYGIAVDALGNAYIVGSTASTNFPTVDAGQAKRNGTNDAFLAKILLTVPLPEITTQPTSQAVEVGSTVQLSVGVSGTAPLGYQWQFDGMNLVNGGSISGATTNLLKISNAQTNNAGFYLLIITNYGGSVTSSLAYVDVTNVPPAIIVQPIGQTNGVGTTVTLAVTATGTTPLSYQWQVDGTNLVEGGPKNGPIISGVTSNLLKITQVQLTNSGTYTVIVTNIAGSVTSSNAVLTVLSSPVIIGQPTNQSVAVGTTVTFAATVVGMVPLSYHWQVNGTDLLNGGHKNGPIISGATTSVLTITNAQTTNSGNYTLAVTNIAGSATSSNAVLVVTNVPPAIIVQPISQTNGAGTTVTLAVTAIGTAPLSYQWQVNGTNLMNGGFISGATTNVLKITNTQTNNSGSYTVIVTNVAGSVTSSNAVLTVLSAPVITMQPTGQSLAVGSTATFAVTAIGMAPLSYRWQVNGTNLMNGGLKNGPIISGATADVLTITNAQTTNSGNYAVIVTNRAGSVTSSNAVLTVTNIPPTITVQPISQTNGVGTNVTLTVAATGTAPLSYQWQVNGTNLVNGGQFSGATTNMLTITNAQTTNSGIYTVIVTNFGGTATSSNAVLTVTNIPPAITVQPKNQSIAMGSNVTFVVTATGTGPLSYQWQVNGTNLVNGGQFSGATTNMLTISNVQTNNSGSYTVIVTNLAGAVTSSNAVLTVLSAPVITMQPTGQSMAVGSTATFAVTAIGIAPLSYLWQVNGTNLVNGGRISGATTSVLTISNAQTTNSGSYTVIITNVAGSATSSNAVLVVTNVPPAITVQPISQTNGAGTTVTLAVTATGTAPLSYQWQVNGTNLVNGGSISGATTNALKITNAQTNNSGSYTVIVTNVAGSVTSSNAVLTVLSAPVITMQPTGQSLAVGSTATFAVTVIGMAPLSYSWQVNGTNLMNGGPKNGPIISGATANVLTISNAQTTNSGNYAVIVTNRAGSVTSSNAVLTVTNIPPTITVQPTNQSLAAGANVTLTVAATGTAPLSYQWQVNGTNLVNGGQFSGATTNVLKIGKAQTNNSGIYTVIVTNFGGTATSSNAVLTVASSPVILVQPTNQTVAVGSAATFAVTAIGIAPLSYQWQVNGTNLVNGGYNGGYINGATTNVLTFGNVQPASSGSYTVIITNIDGSVTSSNAVLTVTNIPPAITLQPTNQTVEVGTTVTLVVTATGTAPLSYQWQVNGTNLVNGGSINGATNSLLTITNAQPTNSGTYTVIVDNPGGSVTSSNAVLVVLLPIFGNIIAAGDGSFIFSGNGGLSNGTYFVLTSTNLVTPLALWTPIATNQFDSQGQFIFTNTALTNTPQLFYILQMQLP